MEIRPIKTKADYRRSLKEIEGLMASRRAHARRGPPGRFGHTGRGL